MPLQRGTATDHRNLLDKLDDFLKNRSVATAAVNAGGTGYVVGDLLSIAGGTVVASMTARLEVTAVSSGVITAVRIYDSGAYSADPGTLTGNGVTGGTGSGATVNITMAATGWTNRINNVSTATGNLQVGGGVIGSDGSGYAVNDIVTLADTLSSTTKAQFRVIAVSGSGDVTQIALETPGDYNTMGSGAFATTGGSGNGALTIDPVFIPTRDEYLWEGSGTGGNAVFIGARTGYAVSEDQVLWELAGFTGWTNGSSDWEAQPGISPGRNNIDPLAGSGSAILLSTSSMSFWFFATTRRVIVVVNVSGNYQSAYLGLIDPYGTDSEIPYPIFICGTADRFDSSIGDAALFHRGPADPTAKIISAASGPGFFREGDGAWQKCWNGEDSGSGSITGNKTMDYFVYPTAKLDIAGLADEDTLANQDAFNWDQMIPAGKTGNPETRLKPSPDSGGDIYFPIQCLLMRSKGSTTHRVLGLLNGLYWVSAEDGLAAGDKLQTATATYRVFKMGANSLSYAHFCVEEA